MPGSIKSKSTKSGVERIKVSKARLPFSQKTALKPSCASTSNHFRQSIIVINHQNGVCVACAHSTSLKNCRKYLHKNADSLIIPRTQPMHGHTLSPAPAKPWHPAYLPRLKSSQQARNRSEYAHQASNPPHSTASAQDQPHATGCTGGAPDQEPVQKSPPAATAGSAHPEAARRAPRNEGRSAAEPAACRYFEAGAIRMQQQSAGSAVLNTHRLHKYNASRAGRDWLSSFSSCTGLSAVPSTSRMSCRFSSAKRSEIRRYTC